MREPMVVRIQCDNCTYEAEYEITILVGERWNDLSLNKKLEGDKWITKDGLDFCSECAINN